MQTLTIRNSLTSLLLTTSIVGACATFAQEQNYIVPRTVDGQPDLHEGQVGHQQYLSLIHI